MKLWTYEKETGRAFVGGCVAQIIVGTIILVGLAIYAMVANGLLDAVFGF